MTPISFAWPKEGLQSTPFEETEEYKRHTAAMKKWKELPFEQQMQFLVDIGIYTPEGQLTEAYGGPPAHPPAPLHSDK